MYIHTYTYTIYTYIYTYIANSTNLVRKNFLTSSLVIFRPAVVIGVLGPERCGGASETRPRWGV